MDISKVPSEAKEKTFDTIMSTMDMKLIEAEKLFNKYDFKECYDFISKYVSKVFELHSNSFFLV